MIECKEDQGLTLLNTHRFGFDDVYLSNNDSLGSTSNLEYNMVKLGIIDQIRTIRTKIGKVIFMVTWFFDMCQKLMKILSWEENTASDIVLLVLIVVFLVVSFVPLRVIICAVLINKFVEGSTWYERRWISNQECCKIEIRNFFYN